MKNTERVVPEYLRKRFIELYEEDGKHKWLQYASPEEEEECVDHNAWFLAGAMAVITKRDKQ